jgi:hypothetical protein
MENEDESETDNAIGLILETSNDTFLFKASTVEAKPNKAKPIP